MVQTKLNGDLGKTLAHCDFVRCRPLTLEVIESKVIWPQKAWDFCRVRNRWEPSWPLDGVISGIPLAAATYAQVRLRTRSLELVHVSGPCGLPKLSRWSSPCRALVMDMLHAPASLRRIRFELVDRDGAPCPRGTLSLRSLLDLFGEADLWEVPVQTRRSKKLHGVAYLASRLRSRCSKAGLLVAVDGNAVTVSRQ